MEQEPEGTEALRTVPARVRDRSWPLLAGLGLAIGVGVIIGAQHAWLASEPGGGLWPNNLFYDFFTVAIVALLGLSGLVAWARGSARGRSLVVGLVAFAVGWGGGSTFGPRWQSPRDVAGTLTVNLVVPVVADLTGPATCTTEANGDHIVGMSASSVGVIGIDELGLRVEGLDAGVLTLLLDGHYGYEGRLEEVESSLDTLTGSALFTATSTGARIGGPTGSATASGTLTWRCGPPTDPSPEPVSTSEGSAPSATPLVVEDALQGYFDLHGLVEWVTCPDTGPCESYGHASGTCSTALELRTDGIETVVPWTDGRQARLRVVPGPEASTLTVTLNDDSRAETVEAPTTLTVMQAGPSVAFRAIEGAFELADGTLQLYVEWGCGDQFEQPGS